MNITELNPWWKGKELIEQDKHIKDLKAKQYQWLPSVLNVVDLKHGNIFTIRGPRQVGKTTLIKVLIQTLLKTKREQSIFYWSCDELVDFRELAAILREYLTFSQSHSVEKMYIFLDEVSGVRNWQVALKSLVDAGALDNSCVVVTGSHTLDLKYGMERLPGRTGKQGKECILLPMSFAAYVALINPKIPLHPIQTLSVKEIIREATALQPYLSELTVLFHQYLLTGGFPLVVNEFLTNHEIPDYVYDLYIRWILGDIVTWGKQEKIAIQLLRALVAKQSTAISWDSLAKEAEIKSHKTVSSYVEDLENMFVLMIAYFLEMHTKAPNMSKNKKMYFLDPFIDHVFRKRFGFEEDKPSIVEAVVLSHLSRLSNDPLSQCVYYWKNKKEVDAVVALKGDIFPVEVKYQTKISREDFKGLFHFKNGVLVTKDYFQFGEKYVAVPVPIFLSLLPYKK